MAARLVLFCGSDSWFNAPKRSHRSYAKAVIHGKHLLLYGGVDTERGGTGKTEFAEGAGTVRFAKSLGSALGISADVLFRSGRCSRLAMCFVLACRSCSLISRHPPGAKPKLGARPPQSHCPFFWRSACPVAPPAHRCATSAGC